MGCEFGKKRIAVARASNNGRAWVKFRASPSILVGSIGMRLGLINRGERRISATSGVGTHVDYHGPVF